MQKQSDALSVFAIVKSTTIDVVSAAHPTQANNPAYKSPYQHKFVADERLEKGYTLQYIGTANLQEDGSYIADLIDTPLSQTLVFRPIDREKNSAYLEGA